MFRLIILLGLLTTSTWAQMRMSVAQLKSFIASSKQLNHDDRKVADFLKKVKLTEKLDAATFEDLQVAGVGPKTVEMLRELRDASKDLPIPPKPGVKPPPPVIPPPPKQEQDTAMAQAREYALNYTKQLPNFLCIQLTRRYYDPAGLEFWHLSDTILTKLSFNEQKEKYELMSVNNRVPQSTSMDQLGGSLSSGEFGSLLHMVFDDKSSARFAWERWATLRGRRMHVFTYFIAQPNSGYQLIYEKSAEYRPALRGAVYVDRDTQMVMRLTLEAVDVPASFPIQQTSVVLDYDFAKISEQEFLLPLRAELKSRSQKVLTKNEIEFRMYRKFSTETNIKFDVPEPLPESQTKEQPIKP